MNTIQTMTGLEAAIGIPRFLNAILCFGWPDPEDAQKRNIVTIIENSIEMEDGH